MNCDDFDQEVLRIARAPAQTRPRPPPPGNAEVSTQRQAFDCKGCSQVPARLDGPSSADVQGTQPKKARSSAEMPLILRMPLNLRIPYLAVCSNLGQ